MSKSLFIGFRVEVVSRIVATKTLIKQYNSKHKTQLFDLYCDGRIVAEKSNRMIVAKGIASEKTSTGLVNFSVMTKMNTRQEIERIVQIVNVLGNDRLIREKIETFVNGHSALNGIPELQVLKDAFINLESMMSGFIKSGWYYAPEAKFK